MHQHEQNQRNQRNQAAFNNNLGNDIAGAQFMNASVSSYPKIQKNGNCERPQPKSEAQTGAGQNKQQQKQRLFPKIFICCGA